MIVLDAMEYATDAAAQAAYVINNYLASLAILFDESNAVFTDKSSNAITLTNTDVTYNASGKYNGCGVFNGTSSKIVAASNSALSFGNTNNTLMGWIKAPASRATNSPTVFWNGIGWGANSIAICVDRTDSAGKVTVWIYNLKNSLPVLTSSTSVNNNTFAHVALVRSLNKLYLYIGGVPEASCDCSLSIDGGGSKPMVFGDQGAANLFFGGSMDEWVFVQGTSLWNGTETFTPYSIIDNSINRYSESTIKQEGSYSLKLVTTATTSLNVTATKTLSPTYNLSGQNELKIWVRASRTGTNFKLGIHDSGGTTTEVTPNIVAADTFQEVTLDLSSVADADKDAIDSIILTVTNADAENTIYLDYLTADNVTWPDAKYVYHGVDRGDGTTGTLHASTISEAAGAGSNLSAGILKDGEVVDDVTGTYAGGGTDFPDPANVLEGDTTNGVPGTYHEAATAEVKNGITFGPSSGYTGTYSPGGTYTEGQAAQLATDQAAVNAAKASIKDDTTILTIAGTYDFTEAIAAAAAAQLVTDQVAVLAKASYIIDSQTILSQAGLYHEATPGEVAYGITFGPSSSYTGTFGQSAVGNEEDIIKNLFIALKARLTAITNDLNTDIADRLYKDVAPHGAQFPYVVASLVTDVPDKTFTEDYSDVYVQFSLFSNDAGSTTELENMYAHLKELYDECELSVTGAYWVWMKRQNATRIDDDTTTENGNSHVFGYAVDYWVRLSKH